jgi:hypothetical protein
MKVNRSLPLGATTRSFLVISAVVGVTQALVDSGDKIVIEHFLSVDDTLVKSSAYIIVGGWIGVLLGWLVLAPMFGKHLDAKYKGWVLRNRSMQRYAVIAGTLSAFATFLGFLVVKHSSPGIIAALASLTIIWTAPLDKQQKQIHFQDFILPALLGLGGIFLVLLSTESLNFTWWVIPLYVLAVNLLSGLSEHQEQTGTRESDGVNFHLWRMTYLAITGTIGVAVLSIIRGNSSELYTQIHDLILGWGVVWAFLVMFFAFISFVLYFELKARKKQAMSTAFLARRGTEVLLASAITLVGNIVYHDAFGKLTIPWWGYLGWAGGLALVLSYMYLLIREDLVPLPDE